MTKFVAVGFKVNQSRSIFYIKSEGLDELLRKLRNSINHYEPDFVSLRMVKK